MIRSASVSVSPETRENHRYRDGYEYRGPEVHLWPRATHLVLPTDGTRDDEARRPVIEVVDGFRVEAIATPAIEVREAVAVAFDRRGLRWPSEAVGDGECRPRKRKEYHREDGDGTDRSLHLKLQTESPAHGSKPQAGRVKTALRQPLPEVYAGGQAA